MKLSNQELSFMARVAYSAQRIADNPRPETRTWDELPESVQMVHEESVRELESGQRGDVEDARLFRFAMKPSAGHVFTEVVEQMLAGRKKFVRELVEEVRPEIERSLESRIAALEARS